MIIDDQTPETPRPTLPKWEPMVRLYRGPEMFWRATRPVQRPCLGEGPRPRQAWRPAALRRAAGQP